MDTDDLEPRKQAPDFTREPLDSLSIHELEERIAALEGEIDRCRTLIASKQSSKAAAEGFFKS